MLQTCIKHMIVKISGKSIDAISKFAMSANSENNSFNHEDARCVPEDAID